MHKCTSCSLKNFFWHREYRKYLKNKYESFTKGNKEEAELKETIQLKSKILLIYLENVCFKALESQEKLLSIIII